MKNQRSLTIGCLAKKLDICVETIRYYHRIGLLQVPAPLPGSAVRAYTDDYFKQLQFIKRAQRLGFSLNENRGLVALANGNDCAEVYRLAQEKLATLEEKMAEIASMRDTIAALLCQCSGKSDIECPIIHALLSTDEQPGLPILNRLNIH